MYEYGVTRKYELSSITIRVCDDTLFKIRALKDFRNVKAGDLGGFVASNDNLSHDNDCWIYDDARVYGNAQVYDNAMIRGNARVDGRARISENAWVGEYARISGAANVCGTARIYGNAKVFGRVQICGYANVSGDAYISTSEFTLISGDTEINRGLWTHRMMLDDKMYLISPTLERILVSEYEQMSTTPT